jgi:arsenite methyltransferase
MSLPVDTGESLRATVRARYGALAEGGGSCCGPSCCGGGTAAAVKDPITADLYGADQARQVPIEALEASLGCGNPTALASLGEGETVLDLGSGGGIDVLLSARRVGPTGQASGLDLTDQMLALARENQRRSGLTNVEFLKGEIEDIPLADSSVDVVISNCVINLSADKNRVMAEAFRVLRPNGRFAVSDVVVRGEVPEPVRASLALWTGCVAGALQEQEYLAKLTAAGFVDIELEPTRIYTADDARAFLSGTELEDERLVEALDGRVMSAFVRARKTGEA